jgi:hypothetical protein
MCCDVGGSLDRTVQVDGPLAASILSCTVRDIEIRALVIVDFGP